MKKFTLACCGLVLLALGAGEARAQGGGAAKGPDPTVIADAELEKEALHNLEVAKHYFKMKKAYVAAATRAEEIVAGYPSFTRTDEALYIAGMSNLYLAEGKGKQKSTAPADKLRDEARAYLSRIVEEFPESDFRGRAEEELRKLGSAKAGGAPALDDSRKPQLKTAAKP
ncbi:MAG TPA: outer membrane protein assembly factor BamD [Pyrinomonadaceae bacterium]